MSAYYLTIAMASCFCLLATRAEGIGLRGKHRYNMITIVLLCLSSAVFIFTGGLRYYVGTDFGSYYNGFFAYCENLRESLIRLDEPGLPIIATVVRWFSNDSLYFIFASTAITYALVLYTQYKNSACFIFSTLLFVFVGNWHGAFNGVRQFLAAAIIFSGHRFIFDRKLFKYLTVVFIAFLFHRSAIVMVIPYFIMNNKITLINLALLTIGTAILSANYERVFELVGLLKESDMSLEDSNYYTTTVNIFRVLVACAPAFLCLILYRKTNIEREDAFYINALFINAAAMVATSNSAYLARLGIYTNMFTPLALSKLMRFKNYSFELLAKICIVGFFAAYWYIEVSGSNTLNNFRWIWER